MPLLTKLISTLKRIAIVADCELLFLSLFLNRTVGLYCFCECCHEMNLNVSETLGAIGAPYLLVQ